MGTQKFSLVGLVMLGLVGFVSTGCDAQGYGYDRGPGYGYGGPPPPRPYDQGYGQERRYGDEQRNDYRGGDGGTAQLRQRQQQYNQSITGLQQQHNQGVVALQQQYNAGHLSRQQLDAGIAQLGRQYGNGVAQQQRDLTR